MSRFRALSVLKNAGSMSLALKALVIAAAVVALYFNDLVLIFQDALTSDATNYVLVIPFIFIYFLYRKRKMLRTVSTTEPDKSSGYMKYFPSISGILLCVMAVVLYWYSSYTFTPLEYHVLTLPVFTAGLVLILFNKQTLREALFPIIFLIFLTPPPASLLYQAGSALAVVSTEASTFLVRLFGIPATISGEFGNPTIMLTRPDMSTMGFTVDLACSGIYPLMGFLIFAFLTAYIVRDKTWKKASIFLLGLPLIYSLNIVRIATILGIGYQYGEQLALQIFHLLGGLVLMAVGIIILLVVSEKLFKTQLFTTTTLPKPCPSCNPGTDEKTSFCESCGRLVKYPSINLHTKDIAKVIAVIAAVALLVSIQVPVFALTQGPAQVLIQTRTGEVGNTQILPQIQNYNVSFIYRDKNFEQLSGQDASLIYSYTPLNATGETIWAAVEVAATRSSLHPWEVCLVTFPQTHGYQPKVKQLDLRDVQIVDNPPIIGRYFSFGYTNYNETQVVLYWYETSSFLSNTTSVQKQVKISLIAYPKTAQDVANVENELLPFAKDIASYWQPIKMWSLVALALSQNGLSFSSATLILLVGTLIIFVFEIRRFQTAKIRTYKKLSKEDQQIVAATWQTQKTSKGKFADVITTYQKSEQNEIDPSKLQEKINLAQQSGLISSRITNINDEPTMVWKTTFKIPKS